MEADGKMLFSRGDQDGVDSDVWDDTELIKAYDDAVAKVLGTEGVDSEDAEKKKTKHRSRRNKQKKTKTRNWRVGDICRVEYSGDGHVYTGTITALDEGNQTCTVQFLDYEEQEEYSLSQLKHVKMRKHRSASESGSVASDVQTTSDTNRHPSNAHGPQSRSSHMPPPPPPPPLGDHRLPPFPHPPWSSTNPSIPFIPPPPPPVLGNDVAEEDSEAMCSMLMSWYMSGYHTGYYQGLREGRKLSGVSQSPYR